MENKTILPAEWFPQSAIQLTWPHEGTDWAPILDEVIPCFVAIAKEIIKREKLLIVCPSELEVRTQLGEVEYSRIIFREMETNDTWARDHGGISVFEEGTPVVYDFSFNGWGMKYVANLDNLITRKLFHSKVICGRGTRSICIPLLEGGSSSRREKVLADSDECPFFCKQNEYLQQ